MMIIPRCDQLGAELEVGRGSQTQPSVAPQSLAEVSYGCMYIDDDLLWGHRQPRVVHFRSVFVADSCGK